MSSDLVAKRIYNVLRRAKDPGLPSIPPDYPLPAVVKLTPATAARALDTIHKLAKTGTPPEGETPKAIVNVIQQLNGDIPNTPPDDPLQALSAREYQVFTLLVDGVRAKEIAARLELSPKTVDTYRASLMRKLDIHDVAGLVKFAIHRDLTSTR